MEEGEVVAILIAVEMGSDFYIDVVETDDSVKDKRYGRLLMAEFIKDYGSSHRMGAYVEEEGKENWRVFLTSKGFVEDASGEWINFFREPTSASSPVNSVNSQWSIVNGQSTIDYGLSAAKGLSSSPVKDGKKHLSVPAFILPLIFMPLFCANSGIERPTELGMTLVESIIMILISMASCSISDWLIQVRFKLPIKDKWEAAFASGLGLVSGILYLWGTQLAQSYFPPDGSLQNDLWRFGVMGPVAFLNMFVYPAGISIFKQWRMGYWERHNSYSISDLKQHRLRYNLKQQTRKTIQSLVVKFVVGAFKTYFYINLGFALLGPLGAFTFLCVYGVAFNFVTNWFILRPQALTGREIKAWFLRQSGQEMELDVPEVKPSISSDGGSVYSSDDKPASSPVEKKSPEKDKDGCRSWDFNELQGLVNRAEIFGLRNSPTNYAASVSKSLWEMPEDDVNTPVSHRSTGRRLNRGVSSPVEFQNAKEVFEHIRLRDCLDDLLYVEMADAIIKPGHRVLSVGPGSVSSNLVAAAMRGAFVDVIQPFSDIMPGGGSPRQTESLERSILRVSDMIRETYGMDLVGGRINPRAYNGRLGEISIPHKTYDVALVIHVFEVLPLGSHKPFMQSLLDSLKDEGVILFSVLADNLDTATRRLTELADKFGYNVTIGQKFSGPLGRIFDFADAYALKVKRNISSVSSDFASSPVSSARNRGETDEVSSLRSPAAGWSAYGGSSPVTALQGKIKSSLEELVEAGFIRNYWSNSDELSYESKSIQAVCGGILGLLFGGVAVCLPQISLTLAIIIAAAGMFNMFFFGLLRVIDHIFTARIFYKSNLRIGVNFVKNSLRHMTQRMIVVLAAPVVHAICTAFFGIAAFVCFELGWLAAALFLSIASLCNLMELGSSIAFTDVPAALEIWQDINRKFRPVESRELVSSLQNNDRKIRKWLERFWLMSMQLLTWYLKRLDRRTRTPYWQISKLVNLSQPPAAQINISFALPAAKKAFTLYSGGAMDNHQAPATATGSGPATNFSHGFPAFSITGKQWSIPTLSNSILTNPINYYTDRSGVRYFFESQGSVFSSPGLAVNYFIFPALQGVK